MILDVFCVPAPSGPGCETRVESRIEKIEPHFIYGWLLRVQQASVKNADAGVQYDTGGGAAADAGDDVGQQGQQEQQEQHEASAAYPTDTADTRADGASYSEANNYTPGENLGVLESLMAGLDTDATTATHTDVPQQRQPVQQQPQQQLGEPPRQDPFAQPRSADPSPRPARKDASPRPPRHVHNAVPPQRRPRSGTGPQPAARKGAPDPFSR